MQRSTAKVWWISRRRYFQVRETKSVVPESTCVVSFLFSWRLYWTPGHMRQAYLLWTATEATSRNNPTNWILFLFVCCRGESLSLNTQKSPRSRVGSVTASHVLGGSRFTVGTIMLCSNGFWTCWTLQTSCSAGDHDYPNLTFMSSNVRLWNIKQLMLHRN